MGYNIYQSQIRGPFNNGTDLFNEIKNDCQSSSISIWHLGIQTDTGNEFKINDKKVMIGKTGIYEIGNTKITQFSCLQNLTADTIIDYVVSK